MPKLKRSILKGDKLDTTIAALQPSLFNLVDLSLQGKQAHWNVLGGRFRSVHLQLDEIIETARMGSDDIAERIATLGVAADGRAAEVAKQTRLEQYPAGLQSVEDTIAHYSDRIAACIEGLREGIEKVGDVDPVSEDLLISVSSALEKHLWMMQAQEE